MFADELKAELSENLIDLAGEIIALESVMGSDFDHSLFHDLSPVVRETYFWRLEDYIVQHTQEIQTISRILIREALKEDQKKPHI